MALVDMFRRPRSPRGVPQPAAPTTPMPSGGGNERLPEPPGGWNRDPEWNTGPTGPEDYLAWLRRVVSGKGFSGADYRTGLPQLDPILRQFGFEPQIASDKTYRGRVKHSASGREFEASQMGFLDPYLGRGGGVFDDPATSEWEQLLRQLTGRLNQPRENPDFQPMVDYLRQYFQKLQGPAYSPNEMDLMQTQALDPLERQRQAERQQVTQRLANRGISQTSGVFEEGIRDVDKRFDEMRTRTQSGFATDAVHQQQQNAQQAAGIGQLLASLQEAQASGDEGRAFQALNLFRQIPDLADRRLSMAQQTLNPLNPMALLQMGQNNSFNQQQQQQQFWQELARLFSQIWG